MTEINGVEKPVENWLYRKYIQSVGVMLSRIAGIMPWLRIIIILYIKKMHQGKVVA
jgi:hypothetical protein